MTRAVLALGANLGSPAVTIRAAIDAIAGETDLLATSGFFETQPVGGPPGQPLYVNAVVVVDTSLTPAMLLELAGRLEARAGRVRDVRWGPRTLDVDLVAVDGVRSADPALTLPHPRAHERAFVLIPWLDADPAGELVGFGPVRDLVAALPVTDRDEVRRLADPPDPAADLPPAGTATR